MLLLHVDYDNEIMVSSYTGSHEFDANWRPSEYNDFLDLSWDPHYSDDLYYRMKLHRAYVRLNTGDFSSPWDASRSALEAAGSGIPWIF